MRWTVMAAMVALAGCAATPKEQAAAAARAEVAQESLEQALAGLTPDKPVTCLPNFQNRQLKAYGQTLVYTVSRNLKYRTDTGGGCEGVARGDILVTRSPQGRLCSGDIAQTVDQASRFPTGSCAMGDFVPYRGR